MVESEKGKGSTFILTLPQEIQVSDQAQEGLPEITEAYETKPVEPIPTLDPSKQTILLIEDDRNFSSFVKEHLQDVGIQYLIAEEGPAGLQMAKNFLPSAIIMDISLPKMDGVTLIRLLKANQKTKDIPVIVISALEEQGRQAIKMGAIHFINKPIRFEQLKEALELLKRRQS